MPSRSSRCGAVEVGEEGLEEPGPLRQARLERRPTRARATAAGPGRSATAGWRRGRRRGRRSWPLRRRGAGRPSAGARRSRPARGVRTCRTRPLPVPRGRARARRPARRSGRCGPVRRAAVRTSWPSAARRSRRASAGRQEVGRGDLVVDRGDGELQVVDHARGGARRPGASTSTAASSSRASVARRAAPHRPRGSRRDARLHLGQAGGQRAREARRRTAGTAARPGRRPARSVARWNICSADSERSTLIHRTSAKVSCVRRRPPAGCRPARRAPGSSCRPARPARRGARSPTPRRGASCR